MRGQRVFLLLPRFTVFTRIALFIIFEPKRRTPRVFFRVTTPQKERRFSFTLNRILLIFRRIIINGGTL